MSDLVSPSSRPPSPGQRWENVERLFRGRITATSAGATQTLYTNTAVTGVSGSSNKLALLTDIWISNIDSSAHTLSLYMVDSSGTVDDDRLLFKALPIAANTTYHVNQCAQLIDDGGTIRAYADATNVVVVRLTGRIIR